MAYLRPLRNYDFSNHPLQVSVARHTGTFDVKGKVGPYNLGLQVQYLQHGLLYVTFRNPGPYSIQGWIRHDGEPSGQGRIEAVDGNLDGMPQGMITFNEWDHDNMGYAMFSTQKSIYGDHAVSMTELVNIPDLKPKDLMNRAGIAYMVMYMVHHPLKHYQELLESHGLEDIIR